MQFQYGLKFFDRMDNFFATLTTFYGGVDLHVNSPTSNVLIYELSSYMHKIFDLFSILLINQRITDTNFKAKNKRIHGAEIFNT